MCDVALGKLAPFWRAWRSALRWPTVCALSTHRCAARFRTTSRRRDFFDNANVARFTKGVTLRVRHSIRGLVSAAWALACASQPAVPKAQPPTALPPEIQAAPAPLARTANPAPLPAPAPAPEWDDKPVFNQEVLALRAKAQARILGGAKLIEDEHGNVVAFGDIPADDQGRPAWVNGNAMGSFVSVENEGALEHFHEALERLATGRDADGKVRIAAYGASHTQGDLYTGYLRYYLQSRFGNGGPGFIQVARLNQWYRKFDYQVKSRGFRTEFAQKKEPPKHGRFGLMGIAVVGQFPYAYGQVFPMNDSDYELTANRYELFYSAEPKSGDIYFSIDETKPVRLEGNAPSPEPRYHVVDMGGYGWHEVRVKPAGNGPVRVYGLSVERATAGVVVDTLGINGTRAANMLAWDQGLWHAHLKRRAPDLITLAYGTNETVDTNEPIETYERNLRQVLASLRQALPEASCVLIGPGDFPREGDDGWKTRERLTQIIDVQRQVAPAFNCGFWDTFAFMGGEDSMHEWVEAKPALGAPDHIHFTARGYVKMGMGFADALMRKYDAFHLQPD